MNEYKVLSIKYERRKKKNIIPTIICHWVVFYNWKFSSFEGRNHSTPWFFFQVLFDKNEFTSSIFVACYDGTEIEGMLVS